MVLVRGQWGNLARMPGNTLFFFEGHPGIFNDRESGPRFNVSSEGWCFLQYSGPITILGHQDPHRPQGEHLLLVSLTHLPTVTQFSQEVSHPGTDQLNPAQLQWATSLGLQVDMAAVRYINTIKHITNHQLLTIKNGFLQCVLGHIPLVF